MEAIRKLGRVPKERPESLEEERKLAVRLRKARYKGNLSEEHKAELAAMKEQEQAEQAEKKVMDSLMEEIRKFGRPPKRSRTASKKEKNLAVRLMHARRGGSLSDEHKADLAAMKKKEQEVQAEKNGKKSLMGDIGEFGRLPKRIRTASKEEQNLAQRASYAKRAG